MKSIIEEDCYTKDSGCVELVLFEYDRDVWLYVNDGEDGDLDDSDQYVDSYDKALRLMTMCEYKDMS